MFELFGATLVKLISGYGEIWTCMKITELCLLQVAEQLFRPLVFQIIHWLTSNSKFESPETIVLLDAFLVSITSIKYASKFALYTSNIP